MVRIYSFEPFGLNKYKNLLYAPECECGCGEKEKLFLNEYDDLYQFAYNVLYNDQSECCALFVDDFYDMFAFIKNIDDEDNPLTIIYNDYKYLDFFAEIDAKFCFESYGLIMKTPYGNYRIIED